MAALAARTVRPSRRLFEAPQDDARGWAAKTVVMVRSEPQASVSNHTKHLSETSAASLTELSREA